MFWGFRCQFLFYLFIYFTFYVLHFEFLSLCVWLYFSCIYFFFSRLNFVDCFPRPDFLDWSCLTFLPHAFLYSLFWLPVHCVACVCLCSSVLDFCSTPLWFVCLFLLRYSVSLWIFCFLIKGIYDTIYNNNKCFQCVFGTYSMTVSCGVQYWISFHLY